MMISQLEKLQFIVLQPTHLVPYTSHSPRPASESLRMGAAEFSEGSTEHLLCYSSRAS